MSHYFDDILSRGVNGKPEKPRRGHMRRSSTARSIGARSDFDDLLDARSVHGGDAPDDPDRQAELQEANVHLHRYVTDQLERVRSDREEGVEDADEYEAQASP